MKKIFTLIATALFTMGASAQTTIFSAQPTAAWDVPGGSTDVEITADYATISGGKMYVTSQQTDAKAMIKSQGGEIAFQCTNNNTFFKVVLNEALQAGDVISARMQSRTDTDLGLWFATGDRPSEAPTARIDLATAAEQAWEEAPSYTVATGDGICGETTFYIYRATGKSTYFNTFAITRSGGGGGGGTTPEFWDASTLDLTTAISARENKNENLKQVPSQYPGEAPATEQIIADATAALVLTDYIFTVQTASVTLTGVSTPNSDGTQADAWRIGSTNANQFLNLDACPVKFEGGYLQAKTGNPSMSDIEYFFTNSDGGRVGPRTVETYWEPGCGKLPAKGEYIEVAFSNAGTFVAGLFIQRPTSNLYIIDKATTEVLAPSAITIAGYNNNNTVKPAEDADAYQPMKLNDDYTISFTNPDYAINTGKQVFGHVSFNVEAGKTYLLLNPKNQLGIYGFQFTPGGDPSGVETIKVEKVWDANAPMYNLSGQQVDKSYKGIVIQNGRKFVNK